MASNETTPPWWSDNTELLLGAARSIASALDARWRGMVRFVLRPVTIDASSIVSGMDPTMMWARATAVRFKFYSGENGGLQGVTPRLYAESDLKLYVGRGIYTPGGTEQPFGGTPSTAGACYSAAPTFGSIEATLPWADWGTPDHQYKTVALSGGILALLQAIGGVTDAYLDVALVLAREGVDGVDISRRLGAWDPFPPLLEVDFTIDESENAIDVIRPSHTVNVERPSHDAAVSRPGHEVDVERSEREISVSRPAHEVDVVRGT